MAGKKEIIREKALQIIEKESSGIHHAPLIRRIEEALPDMKHNTIVGTVIELPRWVPDKVTKPAKGLFLHAKYGKDMPPQKEIVQDETIKEEQFYKSFADWLENELEECSKAIPLGGNIFRDKWGTPDVVGIRKSRPSDIIKIPIEIVAAEIKLNTYDLITAFGQACSYKLFSNKSYIVVPKNAPQADVSRLDSLCLIFGIGLVLFNSIDFNDPQYEIRVRPRKHEPDMFYVNKYMKIIEKELFS